MNEGIRKPHASYNPQEGFHLVDAGKTASSLVEYLQDISQFTAMRTLSRHGQIRLQPHAGQVIADLGCGIGVDSLEMHQRFPGVKILAVDPSITMLRESRMRLNETNTVLLQQDVQSLGLKDNVVDGVFSNRVFQHLTEPERGMNEVRRILRPGSRAVIMDTQWNSLKVKGVSANSAETIEAACGREGYVINSNLAAGLGNVMSKVGLKDIDVTVFKGKFDGVGNLDKIIWIIDSLDQAYKENVITESQREQCLREVSRVNPEDVSAQLDFYIVSGKKPTYSN